MPTFEVSIARSFLIRIQALTAKDAAEASEFFLGYKDDSTEFDKEKYGFEFKKIDMTANDVMEVSEVED